MNQVTQPLSEAEIAMWAATIETHALAWAGTDEERQSAINFSKRVLATIAYLRTVAEVAERVTSAPTELARQNSIVELRATIAKWRGGK